MRRFFPLALALTATSLEAQSIFDVGARVAPQFIQYRLGTPSSTTISEFALPIFVLAPATPALSFDLGSAYTSARVQEAEGKTKTTSTISGFTDTQIRAHYTIGTDFVVLTGGVNLPTGRSTVRSGEVLAAGLIGSDFLAFPISNMGTGFGGTGGIAVARPVGDWNIGAGASVRHSAQYDPVELSGSQAVHYQPGNEYRLRMGGDRALGTGRITVGLTYSTFGNDELGGSVYNTGDRYLGELSVTNTVGVGQLTVAGWDLFRAPGTIADGSSIGRENISNLMSGYAMRTSRALVEPTLELRGWTQADATASYLANVSVRLELDVAGYAVSPSVGYSLGRVAAEDANGGNTSARLTGFRGILAIRLR